MLIVPVGRVINCQPRSVSGWPRVCLFDSAGETNGVVMKVVLLKRRCDGVVCRCGGHDSNDDLLSWLS